MQMMQQDYRPHSRNTAKGTTTIQGFSSFAFLRVSTRPTILISTLVWFGIWVWFDKFGLGVWVYYVLFGRFGLVYLVWLV